MSDYLRVLVLHFKQVRIINDMAKLNIKPEKNTPFGGIFHFSLILFNSIS